MFSLTNKSAIVTGGAAGIGLAIAQRLIAAGCRVLIADRRPNGAKSAETAGAEFVVADVSRENDISAMFQTALKHFGHIDILVNNAGIQPLGVGFAGLTEELLRRTFDVNVNGVALGLKHAARHLADSGRIINIASFVGVLATPGVAAYATSKAAVVHLTRLAAIELATRRITVNAISPGTILTPAVTEIGNNPEIPFVLNRTPLGRLGQPEDVAAACHFLASDEAGFITGQNLLVDGGLTAGWTEYDLVPPANVQNGAWVDDVTPQVTPPHPGLLSIRWGEGGRRPGEGSSVSGLNAESTRGGSCAT
jgi:NAD(P)-dependent dehydrogenase (short-subunit alcohol dehydrogenase family)